MGTGGLGGEVVEWGHFENMKAWAFMIIRPFFKNATRIGTK